MNVRNKASALLLALLFCSPGIRAQEVGFVSAEVVAMDQATRTGTAVVSVTGTDGKPLELFDKSYGSFPSRVSPIGGTFARIEIFAYLCANDFPTPPGPACRWVPMTVNRYPVSTGTIPGRDLPDVFRVTFKSEPSEVGDQDLATPGKAVPILVQAKVVQSGAIVLNGGTQVSSEREVVTVWRVP
jgi:hypothetical protein